MKKFIVLIFVTVVLLNNSLIAQSRSEVKADKYFDQYSYHLAYQQYQHIRKKSTKVYRRMATCQEFMENYALADSLWRKVCASPDAEGNDYWRYSQVLKVNGQIDQSVEWSSKAAQKLGKDKMNSKSNTDEIKKLAKDNGRYVVQRLKMNSNAQEFSPFRRDSIFIFASTREGLFPVQSRWNGNDKPYLDIYMGKVGKDNEVTEIKKFSKSMKGPFHDGPVCFNKQFNRAIFTSNSGNKKNQEGLAVLGLYESKLVDGVWQEAQPLPCNSVQFSCGHACFGSDDNEIYFVSDQPGGLGGSDIYRMKMNKEGVWSKPENIGPQVNTEGNEVFPYFQSSGLLLFSSNGHTGLGGLDIFVAKLDGGKVRKILNLGAPVNSNFDDLSAFLSEDGTNGYFASNRNGGSGSDDLYRMSVLTPWEFEKELNIMVKNKEGVPFANTEVVIKDDKGQVVQKITTDAEGKVKVFSTDWSLIQLECSAANYEPVKLFKNAKELASGEWIELIPNRVPQFNVVGTVKDAKSGSVIDQVKVNLDVNATKGKNLLYTDSKGEFKVKLDKGFKVGDQIEVTLSCSKAGYFPVEQKIKLALQKEGDISINSLMELKMEKIEVGKDLGKVLDIKPIYFDLGKYAIRPDAATELDKIVAYMNENPTIEIELGSHTDCRGSKASNEKLSASRAKASADYVKSRITNPKRIYGKGYGESQLVNKCECEGKVTSPCTEEEHQANRRTEFKVIKI
jgi:outer membrane protein OmpA-like peptidoglycan-associated protein